MPTDPIDFEALARYGITVPELAGETNDTTDTDTEEE